MGISLSRMKPPDETETETRPPPTTAAAMPEFRDWAGLPELPLSEVLRRLLPCLRSIHAFAAVCRPWRRLLRASAADLLLPGTPPLLLNPRSRRIAAFSHSRLALARPLAYRADLPAEGAILLSASRGRLLLLLPRPRQGDARIVILDALTGADRREIALPSPRFAYHYAALLPAHLLVFHCKHAFFSLPFPDDPSPNPSASGPRWTKHSLPRSASFVTGVIEFRGRVLGLTDRAQLLEFSLCASPQGGQTVRILPATGLPDAKTFDHWHFGPRLIAAGDRLLLVLFMLEPGSLLEFRRAVNKVAVYGLDMARMRWEEVDNIGAYSLFVDCAGKSAAACTDVGSCGVEENRIYVVAPGCSWRSFPPGWEASLVDVSNNEPFSRRAMERNPWPSNIWVYPPLFF